MCMDFFALAREEQQRRRQTPMVSSPLTRWYETERAKRSPEDTQYQIFTPAQLMESVSPYVPQWFSFKQLGLDASKTHFLQKKRVGRGMLYCVDWRTNPSAP